LRGAGLAVTLWHEERESELAALVLLEADGICTNAPARLRKLIDRQRRDGAQPQSINFERKDPLTAAGQ
jgi:hypothetical protein